MLGGLNQCTLLRPFLSPFWSGDDKDICIRKNTFFYQRRESESVSKKEEEHKHNFHFFEEISSNNFTRFFFFIKRINQPQPLSLLSQ